MFKRDPRGKHLIESASYWILMFKHDPRGKHLIGAVSYRILMFRRAPWQTRHSTILIKTSWILAIRPSGSSYWTPGWECLNFLSLIIPREISWHWLFLTEVFLSLTIPPEISCHWLFLTDISISLPKPASRNATSCKQRVQTLRRSASAGTKLLQMLRWTKMIFCSLNSFLQFNILIIS